VRAKGQRYRRGADVSVATNVSSGVTTVCVKAKHSATAVLHNSFSRKRERTHSLIFARSHTLSLSLSISVISPPPPTPLTLGK